jgi:tetratricopeptide (TPR) repeat protein
MARLYEAALAKHRSGQLPEAEELYRRILQVEPGHAGARHYLGVVALQLGDVDRALDLLQASVETCPGRAEFWNNLGRAWLAADTSALAAGGNVGPAEGLERAAACFRRAIELDGRCVDAFSNLGHLLLKTGQAQAAIAPLQRAVQESPTHYEALCNLGWAQLQTGDDVSAEQTLLRAIDSGGRRAAAYRLMGAMLIELGRCEEATERLQFAAERQPKDARIWFLLGLAAELMSCPESAARHYERALELNPSHAGAAHNLQILSNYLDRASMVVRHLEERLAGAPDDADLLTKYGAALWRAGLDEHALEVLEESAKRRPDHAETLWQLARVRRSAGAAEHRCDDVLRRAGELAPGNTFIRAALDSVIARDRAKARRDGQSSGRRIALFLEQPYHYHVQKPIFDAACGRFPLLMTSSLRELKEFDPDIVVVSSSQSASLRFHVPRALFVWTRHGLISKTTTHQGARAADFACLTSEASREWYVRNRARPRRDFWMTGFVQMDPLFRSESEPLPFAVPADRPVVVYAPTWTPDLASAEMFGERLVEHVRGESPDVVLIIKPHPVSFSHTPHWIENWRRLATETEGVILADDPALNIVPVLKAADVLLGDASSVLFQFLALDRPLVLVDNPRRFQSRYFDAQGIEWQWRDMGRQVEQVEEVPRAIAEALSDPSAQAEARHRYRRELFGELTDGRAGERIVEHMAALEDSEWTVR